MRLRRVLGVAFGVTVGIGGAIGVGILRVPALIAERLPDPLWIAAVWLAVVVYQLIDANSTAELAAMLPEAGGPYVYVTRAFGAFPGFVVGWVDWVLNTSATAFVAVAFTDFLAELWPAPGRLAWLPAGLIGGLAGVQWLGVRSGGRAQLALGAAKAGGFLLVAVACLFAAPAASAAGPPGPGTPTAALPGGFALLAAVAASWRLAQETFAGATTAAVYFGEESTDPGRTLPRAIFGSVLAVTAVYLLIVAAVLHVLGIAGVSRSTLPLADAARAAFGDGGRRAVLVVALVSLLGHLNADVMFTPRILFAIARDGLFSGRAVAVNAGGTPAAALLITVAAATLLALTNTFEQLFLLTAFIGLAVPLSTSASLLALRRRAPELPRPYRALGHPWLPLVGAAVPAAAMASAVALTPGDVLVGLGLVALAYPAFRLVVRGTQAPVR